MSSPPPASAMDSIDPVDETFMERALMAARTAAAAGEVPVGAVAVAGGQVCATASNAPIARCDPTAHAEVLALRRAARHFGNYRLPGVTLYVTLEPCPMCVGAMVHARIDRLVFGAADPRSGAVGSCFDLALSPCHNHRLEITGGIRAQACGEILREFFRARRR